MLKDKYGNNIAKNIDGESYNNTVYTDEAGYYEFSHLLKNEYIVYAEYNDILYKLTRKI